MALIEIKTDTQHYYEDANGLRQGEYKSWYSNGKPHIHCYYLNGEYHGEYKSWWRNGTLFAHCYYLDDQLHGECKAWHENGNPLDLIEHSLYYNGTKVCNLDSPSEEDKILLSLKHGVTNWL